MKAEKGQYGYRDSSRKMRLAVTAALALAVLAQVCWRFFVDSQAAKNIFTVMAILTVLPMANMAAPLLASWRYRTPSREYPKNLAYKAKAEKSLNALFAANKLDSHVKVIQEEGSFFCRLDSLKPMEGWEDDGSVEYGAGLLKSLSM